MDLPVRVRRDAVEPAVRNHRLPGARGSLRRSRRARRSNQAGGYSPLTVTFSREDADQDLGGLAVTTPPGLSGTSRRSRCAANRRPRRALPRSEPDRRTDGRRRSGSRTLLHQRRQGLPDRTLHGAPFGLSIDVSEKAGPLDLGTGPCDCEVVRATVNVDPHTAQLTVSSGALPTMKDGIPFQVKTVNVNINRPEFMFNPTSCDPMSVNGTLSSTQGMTSQQAYHFQVTNCAALAFKPGFKVSTSGKTNRANGASLDAKLSFPRRLRAPRRTSRGSRWNYPSGCPRG